MKILKEGKLKHHNFICDNCGCEFVADETEYKFNSQSKSTGKIYYSMKDMCDKLQYKYEVSFECQCPTCKMSVLDEIKSTDEDRVLKFCECWNENEVNENG